MFLIRREPPFRLVVFFMLCYNGLMKTFNCIWCKKNFQGRIHDGKIRQFCGSKCHWDFQKSHRFTTKCLECGKEYNVPNHLINTTKYCGIKCSNTVKGRTSSKPWGYKIGLAKLGKKNPWTTKRNLENNPGKRGKESPMWKGDDVGYIALHNWAHKYVKLKDKCETCDSIMRLEMANVSQQYKRELDDWKTLCRKCHLEYDSVFRRSGGVSRKLHKWSKNKNHL